MKGVLLFLLSFSFTHSHAQDRWTVRHSRAEVLAATGEDTVANRIAFKDGDLKKWGALRISYIETPERTGWRRSLILDTAFQKERRKQNGSTMKIRNRTLRQWLRQSQALYLYTSSLPTNPAVAATVRVRRVHLCTFALQP